MDGIDLSEGEFRRLVGNVFWFYVDALLTFVSLRLLSRNLDAELSNSPLEESETRSSNLGNLLTEIKSPTFNCRRFRARKCRPISRFQRDSL